MIRLGRRHVLLLPLLAAACADDDEIAPPATVMRDFQPLRSDLPPIELNVQRLEIAERDATATAGEVLPAVSVNETLFNMARDRIVSKGAAGTATFRVLSASIVYRRDTLTGALAVRLDVANDDGTGFIEAHAGATKSGRVSDPGAAGYEMLKTMMDELNVDFEFQIRNKLRDWIYGQQPVRPRPEAVPPPADRPIDLSPRR